jgi:predicted heme/steroid binding protein
MAIYALLVLIALLATFVISPRLGRPGEPDNRPRLSQEQYRAQGRVTVLYRGRIYDLTGSRRWPEGHHVKRHEAWQDLTGALAEAPHGAEVLERFAMIEEAGGERAVGERAGGSLLGRAFQVMQFTAVGLALAVVLVVAAW